LNQTNFVKNIPDKYITFFGDHLILFLSNLFQTEQNPYLQYAGLPLSNPWGFASGWADTLEKMEAIIKLGAGAVVSKTITLNPKSGNPYPRFFKWKDSMINSMGLPNKGLAWWLSELKKQQSFPRNFIFSVKGDNKFEWKILIKSISQRVTTIELNFSCPNVKDGIIDIQQTTKILSEIRKHKAPESKIFVKLSPEYSTRYIIDLLQSVKEKGLIDGITCFNTIPVQIKYLGNPLGVGGLSGRPLYNKMVDSIKEIRKYYKSAQELPIFAVGGIWNLKDIKKMWSYDALPFVLSVFLIQGPLLFKKWNYDIKKLKKRDKLKHR
jgi:dihydroorotate dehydrogenase